MLALKRMMNTFTAPALVLVAFGVLSGMTGAVYASGNCGISPNCTCGGTKIDLKIMDQNESWRDGVTATWTASNMAPGQVLNFSGSFVGLRSSDKGCISVAACYCVTERSPFGDMDKEATNLVPDNMAKKLILTRCVYSYSGWQIDCLTGEPTGMTKSEKKNYGYPCAGWRIQDADRDGRITLCDLKRAPLESLPLPADGCGARFVMSLKFAEDAGNNLQGDDLNLTMSYTLRPW
jgi:hypothetical protein